MATNTWSAAGASTWATDASWSLGHAPSAGEDVVFDITSTQNCTVGVATNAIAYLTITSDYTGTITLTADITITRTATGTPYTIATGPTFAGALGLNVGYNSSSSGTLTLGALNIGARPLKIQNYGSGACIVDFAGNITASDGSTYILKNSTGSLTVNTNNYTWSMGGLLGGNANATGTTTLNCGSSTITTKYSVALNSNTGNTQINLQTCSWSVANNWTMATTQFVNPGTSTVTITDTSTLTMYGCPFYNLTINASGKTITLGGNVFVRGTYTLTAGSIAASGNYIFENASGDSNIWSAPSAGLWSTDANWSKGHKPEAGEVIIFDETSTQNCTVDVNSPTMLALGVSKNYTGTITDGGYSLTTSRSFCIASGGACTLTGTSTVTGDYNHSFFSTGTMTCTAWSVVLQGTGNFTPYGVYSIKSLTCAANSKTTTKTGSSVVLASTTTPLTVGTGTLAISAGVIYVNMSASGSIISSALTCTIGGASALQVAVTGNGVTCTLPGVTGTGTGSLQLCGSVLAGQSATLTLTGAVSYSTGTTMLRNLGSATGPITINMGSYSHTIADFDAGYTDAKPITLNMQTCSVSVATSYQVRSSTTVNEGTSQVTMTGTSTIVTAGSKFYSLICNSSGNVTRGDAITCTNYTGTAGTLTGGSSVFTCTGVFAVNGGAFTHTGTVTCSGTSVTFGNATYTTTLMTLALTGSIMTLTLGKSLTISALKSQTAKQRITWSTGAYVLTVSGYTSGDWGGSASGRVVWTGPGNIKAPAGVTVTYMDVKNISNSTGTLITATGLTNMNRGGNTNWDVTGASVPGGYFFFFEKEHAFLCDRHGQIFCPLCERRRASWLPRR